MAVDCIWQVYKLKTWLSNKDYNTSWVAQFCGKIVDYEFYHSFYLH